MWGARPLSASVCVDRSEPRGQYWDKTSEENYLFWGENFRIISNLEISVKQELKNDILL